MTHATDDILVFETELDAAPEKIWRALTIPEYRDRWLQKPDNVDVHLDALKANSLLTFRWLERQNDDETATAESRVTIELTELENGCTGFRLTHAPVIVPAAANSNMAAPTLMRAA